MKLLRPASFFAIVVAIGACSLNPQPFPPAPQDNGDDRGGTFNSDGGAQADAATPKDDAGTDSGMDSGSDSATDAGMDSALDAPSDADPDADLDGGSSLVSD